MPQFLKSRGTCEFGRKGRRSGVGGTKVRGNGSASMKPAQHSLFEKPAGLPAGLDYSPDLLSPGEERALVTRVAELAFRTFEFHGFEAKRRVVSFGHRYNFGAEKLQDADLMPEFLTELRRRAAAFAGLAELDLKLALVTEYAPGASIGWHRDKGVFDKVVGVSLLAPCTFRLRKRLEAKWQRASFVAEPRSAYLLDGPSRSDWEHSIPAVDALRYSITFRSLRAGAELMQQAGLTSHPMRK